MQTFNYLINRFLLGRQLWQAEAIVNQLRVMKQEGFNEEVYVDRLLPVWEVITENLMRHSLQTHTAELGHNLSNSSRQNNPDRRVLYEV